MSRRTLPARRRTIHEKIAWKGRAIFLSCSYYDDGALGEIFLAAGKLTSEMDITAKDAAIAISLALQHGCPVETLAKAFLHDENGNPEGIAAVAMQTILKSGL